MPLTPNMLIQAAAQAKTQAATANPSPTAIDTGANTTSFAQVFAQETTAKPAVTSDGPAKPGRDKASDSAGNKDVPADKSAAVQPAVADNGKSLPADKPVVSDDSATTDDTVKTDAPVADSAPVDPAVDPALLPVVQPTLPVADVQAPPVVVPTPQVEAPPAAVASAVQAPVVAPVVDPDFNPHADPLDSLPAVRLAMEQGGHVSAASQAQPKAAPPQAEGELTSAQTFASGMASMLEVQVDKDSTSQGGEKAFSGLINDGLKDLKSASSDTRVDDFANRLAALTQAATPKTANALPVNQPIAMHQSGWTEEVVNRVMYLSSANLKAADIQLQPAELGRLDIRVNMIPDQQTQVTFMSAHSGVREALEGQMHRLRDMFNQQGMGQVDVNVSDQSRGWQGQGQDQARQGQGGRANASGGQLDSMDEELATSVAEVAANTTSVIGSSAVDYYA
ncbi:flagellar hook-length control protein FliK [Pseudomonas purpurea]|uniref:flagellar hook-length control protein FliK n=1 Tax=Pseudomonas purpurea TaxID=3136737 RepID=UPI003265A7FE